MNKEKRNSLLITICVIVGALLVIGLAVYNSVSTSGVLQRNTVAAESENYKVDGMMFAYFYNSQYQNYSSAFSYLGVQQGVSLKSQSCPYLTDGGSWFDYLVRMTRDYVKNMLGLCEIGHEKGNTLTDEDRAEIAEQINRDAKFHAFGFDSDPEAVALTLQNAKKAGVADRITVIQRDIKDFVPVSGQNIVCNPPYGERMLDVEQARKLYHIMGTKFPADIPCSIISPDKEFEKCFGKKARKRRKLYNGMMQCQLYQYWK